MNRLLLIEKGDFYPLGATPDKKGINFSLFSEHAEKVELLLFESHMSKEPFMTVLLDKEDNKTYNFWHCFVKGLIVSRKNIVYYAYRVFGPEHPSDGHRFDSKKVVIDPYCKGISATLYNPENAVKAGDNIATSLRSVVVDTADYNWEGDRPLNRPWNEIIIYEMHVRGFTKSENSGVKNPGTYAGVIEKIPYLKELGVTAVELLPVFEFNRRDPLRMDENGKPLNNYWGYDPIGFFIPESTYCNTPEVGSNVNEFRDMVKALHKAEIEVYLDVVYNHTSEGNHLGPTIHFKGIDNSVYYHLMEKDKKYYRDFTGCGNTINSNHPIVQKFIYDSLKFWVEEMHVDGFRFDLASVLTRGINGEPLDYPPILWNLELSDIFARTKLIAEAWDAVGLYQIGSFSGKRWTEWNGKYRDSIRKFVKGDGGLIGEVASRIAGSSDVYSYTKSTPHSSINFITCHDGFTMNDLVSYNEKHNEANGENNRDGSSDNSSSNCGVEGSTDNAQILSLRKQKIKNFFVLLMLSKGVPMMLCGDEVAHTQHGNNNAYCQDNEISWFNWDEYKYNKSYYEFVKKCIEFRKSLKGVINKEFYNGVVVNPQGFRDIEWHGLELDSPNWGNSDAHELAFVMGAFERGVPDVFVMMNMGQATQSFAVPKIKKRFWHIQIDTSAADGEDFLGDPKYTEAKRIFVKGHSIMVLVSKNSKSGGENN